MKQIAIIVLALIALSNASVLKKGKNPAISADEIHTPHGMDYLKKHFYGVIFPGTKWCGDGDIADDFDDLGYFEETDKCCRTHDFCDDIIIAGESKHGLENNGLFTRLNCKCDLAFFDCLDNAKCKTAGVVATGYFNILGAQCFEYKHPATCVEFDDILGMRERCVKYDYDTTKPEEWQWFDMPRWLFGSDDKLDC